MLHVAKCTGKKTWSVCVEWRGGWGLEDAQEAVQGMVASFWLCSVISLAWGLSEKALWVLKMPGLRGEVPADGRCHCFLSLPPGSSTSLGWSAHPSVHLHHGQDCEADAPVESVMLCTYLEIIGSKALCCYVKIYWRENFFISWIKHVYYRQAKRRKSKPVVIHHQPLLGCISFQNSRKIIQDIISL